MIITRRPRPLAAVAAPLVVLAGLVASPATVVGSTAAPSAASRALSSQQLAAGVVVHAGVASASRRPAAARRPFLSRTPTTAPPSAPAVVATTPPTNGTPIVLANFAGSSLSSDISSFGGSQGVEPPDTQVAVGTAYVVEAVNSVMRVTDKAGAQSRLTDLNVFFQFPAGYSFTDPRVEWDDAAQRWYVTGFGFDAANDSIMKVATSQTADPNGTWRVSTVTTRSNVIADQPKLGFDSNVLVMAWDDYSGSSLAFQGSETWVLQKSDLIAGNNTRTQNFAPTMSQFSVVPAQSYDGGTTAYAAENDSCGANTVGACSTGSSNLMLIAITGTPATNDVARTISHVQMAATTVPANADQPGPSGATSIATNDDRFLNDVLAGGVMYVTGNDSCTPSGDITARPCGRLLEVNPSSRALTLSTDVGSSGKDIYFPAPVPDPAGDLAIAATESSTSQYPTAVALTAPANSTAFVTTSLQAGSTPYAYGTCRSASSPDYPCRWGDYSAAARDPSSPGHLWLASEWGGTANGNWATQVSEVSLRQMNLTPSTTSVDAGAPFTVTVAVTDGSGAALPSYTGTVHVTSSDPGASLPPDYTFTAADAGTHSFSVALVTAGAQTITATDATGLTATTPPISVVALTASRLALSAPASTTTVQQVPFTVTAEDQYGNTVSSYTGRVHVTSSDPNAVLPPDHTFTSGDNGVHSFVAQLTTVGTETITATDTTTTSITGTATVSVVPPPIFLSSPRQYELLQSDGATWQPIDTTNLSTTVNPGTTSTAVITANIDLWTAVSGYNQDVAIRVTPQGAASTIVAWKESGGSAGIFSPNAATVQATYAMTAGTTYTVDLVWKTNIANGADGHATPSNIFAGAGGAGAFSPTTLDVSLVPPSGGPTLLAARSSVQYTLTPASSGGGADWVGVDTNVLSLTLSPTVASTAYLTANADLWTSVAGVNQDIGINVAPPCNNDPYLQPVSAWKESGGNAGTFSPNAAFVQDACDLAANTTYTVTLDWKSSRPLSGQGSIVIGAGGPQAPFSPTTLFAQVFPSAGAPQAAVTTAQSALTPTSGDDGSSFRAVNNLGTLSVSTSSTCTAWITGNADLWTASSGYNQDLGIEVTPQGGSPTLLAWKESGGNAGVFSPNAAFVQGAITLPAGAYTVTLVWRANRALPSATKILIAAGSAAPYSPTSLLAQLSC